MSAAAIPEQQIRTPPPESKTSSGFKYPQTSPAATLKIPVVGNNSQQTTATPFQAQNGCAIGCPDPRFKEIAMRIAGHYQRLYQAAVLHQQRRFEALAALQQKKYQEVSRGSMMVIAWYIRDRIQRRQQRQKRRFLKGLCQRRSIPETTTRQASVKKWLSQQESSHPLTPESSEKEAHEMPMKPEDGEEARFTMEALDPKPKDADVNLLHMADSLIKQQLATNKFSVLKTAMFEESDESSDTDGDEDMCDDMSDDADGEDES